ncbi:MAG TPA: TolC family protein, partial [Chitinophagaceae bacterium]|nr:TolC family protein [Chitinophagaceae bacterium]
MKPLTLSVIVIFTGFSAVCQQANTIYSLEDLTRLAQNASARSAELQLQQKIASYQYNLFRLAARPAISFNGNVPVYNKDNFAVVQPDGTVAFRSRSQSNSDANFSIAQTFPTTNSKISLNTYLNRYDDYFEKRTSYNATLFYIQLQQPVFSYNQYKWDKRIEPLRFKESQLAAATASNELSLLICQLYFDVIEAEADLELANANLSYAKKNKAAEARKKELGVSTDDKVLQLEMMELEASASVEQSLSAVATAKASLKNFLGLQQDIQLRMPGPGSMPELTLQSLMASAERVH